MWTDGTFCQQLLKTKYCVINSSSVCFKCGKTGHIARECKTGGPATSKQSGNTPIKAPTTRTFNMTVGEAIRDAEVIAGTLFLNSINAHVLFDSGATKIVYIMRLCK